MAGNLGTCGIIAGEDEGKDGYRGEFQQGTGKKCWDWCVPLWTCKLC